MISIKNINIDYKFSIIFGGLALVISLLAGIISGVSMHIVAIRAAVFTALFAAVAFGLLFVLKKFVPEVYSIISSEEMPGMDEETDLMDDEGYENGAADSLGVEKETGLDDAGKKSSDSGFEEIQKDDLPHIETVDKNQRSNDLQIKDGKLGKHIVETEKIAMYEPKVMAQAIRTMMSKDQD